VTVTGTSHPAFVVSAGVLSPEPSEAGPLEPSAGDSESLEPKSGEPDSAATTVMVAVVVD
jgi:hypothetical protein